MSSTRKKIMDYLSRWEGNHLHKNSTEDYITSAYGIYKKSFPDAAIFKFYEQIADELGVSTFDRPGREVINKFMDANPIYKEVEEDLAWQFYVDNFMGNTILQYLPPKSALSFFSISVNGGKKRANKALQTAVNKVYEEYQVPKHLVVDGIVGKGTKTALKELVGNGLVDDNIFNQYMLEYMNNFYHYLAKKNLKNMLDI